MARSLERAWPYVVRVDRRFKRPQHKVRGEWRFFDTPLILREGVDRTLRLLGCSSIKSLDSSHVAVPNSWL